MRIHTNTFIEAENARTTVTRVLLDRPSPIDDEIQIFSPSEQSRLLETETLGAQPAISDESRPGFAWLDISDDSSNQRSRTLESHKTSSGFMKGLPECLNLSAERSIKRGQNVLR